MLSRILLSDYKLLRHLHHLQICVHDKEDYGVFKGIANVELICENNMILHILPSEEDFDTVYQSLLNPPQYLSLGRYEDLLDIKR